MKRILTKLWHYITASRNSIDNEAKILAGISELKGLAIKKTDCAVCSIVISEGFDDYYVFWSEQEAKKFATRKAIKSPGEHLIVYNPVCGYVYK